jgi:GT2 family glycosyltransferase
MNKYLENQEIDTGTKKLYYVEQIPFAFFMTTRAIYKSIGMMDENYYLFFEDVDMSYSIAKKYKLALDTSLKTTHLGGSSFKNEDNWNLYGIFIYSMLYFFKKNYSKPRAFILKLLSASNSIIIVFIEYLKKVFGRSDKYRLRKHKFFLSKLFN